MQIDEAPWLPPSVIHFCWANCFTLTLDHGVYVRADGTPETWTIDRFTPTSVILHRHDSPVAWNGFSTDVVYAGSVVNDRLTDVTVNGKPVGEIGMAWGDALDALPGSNAEREQRKSAQQNSQTLAQSTQYAADPAQAAFEPSAEAEWRTAEEPPPLPDDEQPPSPDSGYLWTPGYWGWGTSGYYWVPGIWVQPPRVGLLWTPGYWGFVGAVFVFHPGYWGPHIGYYGGIDYGFGYGGVGFALGHTPSRIRVSYQGGPGGTTAQPTAAEKAAASEPHRGAVAMQRQHLQYVRDAAVAATRATHPGVAAASTPARVRFQPAATRIAAARPLTPGTASSGTPAARPDPEPPAVEDAPAVHSKTSQHPKAAPAKRTVAR